MIVNKEQELLRRIEAFRKKLETIIETTGIDAGVIYLSHESETEWNEEGKCFVDKYQYFSPLGEALMALYKLTDLNHDLHPGLY